MGVNQYIKIGERMKNTRFKHGLSQRDTAKKLGIAISTYSNYENGYREPPTKVIQDFCDLFNVEIKDLLGITVTYEPETTLAAHFDGDEYTQEELNEIRQFAEFIKSKRKATPPDQDEPEALEAANDRGATPEEKKNADDIMHNPDEWE